MRACCAQVIVPVHIALCSSVHGICSMSVLLHVFVPDTSSPRTLFLLFCLQEVGAATMNQVVFRFTPAIFLLPAGTVCCLGPSPQE